jgi:hypothetical protein
LLLALELVFETLTGFQHLPFFPVLYENKHVLNSLYAHQQAEVDPRNNHRSVWNSCACAVGRLAARRVGLRQPGFTACVQANPAICGL